MSQTQAKGHSLENIMSQPRRKANYHATTTLCCDHIACHQSKPKKKNV